MTHADVADDAGDADDADDADAVVVGGPSKRPGPIAIWILAARPKTLPAALVGVIVGSAVAAGLGSFDPLLAVACLAGALLIQIGTNLVNDYYDGVRGTDNEDRLGPTRVTAAGLASPRAVFVAFCLVFGAALAVGGYLVSVAGWPILVIGIASIVSGWAYTGGPYPLGYHGLGDPFVFVFFGPVAVCGTAYVMTGLLPDAAIAASVPVGLLTTAIIVVNNLRDVDTDAPAGKRTLAVRIGKRATKVYYIALLTVSFVVGVGTTFLGTVAGDAAGDAGAIRGWFVLGALPVAIPPTVRILRKEGRDLNPALGWTALLLLVFSALLAAALWRT